MRTRLLMQQSQVRMQLKKKKYDISMYCRLKICIAQFRSRIKYQLIFSVQRDFVTKEHQSESMYLKKKTNIFILQHSLQHFLKVIKTTDSYYRQTESASLVQLDMRPFLIFGIRLVKFVILTDIRPSLIFCIRPVQLDTQPDMSYFLIFRYPVNPANIRYPATQNLISAGHAAFF